MESGTDQSNQLPTCRVWASVVCSERDWRKYLTRLQIRECEFCVVIRKTNYQPYSDPYYQGG